MKLLSIFPYYFMYLIELAVIFFIIRFLFKIGYRTFHSHWNTLIDNFSYSAKEFYEAVTEELKATEVDGIDVNFVFLKEGSLISKKRAYLRVSWKDFDYDICCAPFGKGFFISWWLRGKLPLGEVLLGKIPFIGKTLVNLFYPNTYYQSDSASMFMTYAQSTVQSVIKKITEGKGTRALTELEKKPILNNIFKR